MASCSIVGVGARNGVTTIGAILFFPSAVKKIGKGSGEGGGTTALIGSMESCSIIGDNAETGCTIIFSWFAASWVFVI